MAKPLAAQGTLVGQSSNDKKNAEHEVGKGISNLLA